VVTPGLPTFGLSTRSLTEGPVRNSSVIMRSAAGLFAPWQKSFWQTCSELITHASMPGTLAISPLTEQGRVIASSAGPPSSTGGGGAGAFPPQAESATIASIVAYAELAETKSVTPWAARGYALSSGEGLKGGQ